MSVEFSSVTSVFQRRGKRMEQIVETLEDIMEDPEKDSHSSAPPVPPQTYRWEEIRRQKLLGLYPWTHVLKPPFDLATWEKEKDHEYEPITPMATQPSAPTPPPVVKVTESTEEKPKVKKGRSSKIEYIDNDPNFLFIPLHGSTDEEQELEDKQYLRIPRDEELIVPQDIESDADGEDNNQDDQEDRDIEDEELSAQEIQNRLEERFFAPTPTTTESRTDCEFNTSQIDSSGLEDLPLKRESRKAADMSGKGFQQRIRSQAGRLRTKIRSIQKPKINLPDKSKFHLPERPKFNLPERPKFKMPERPKISLPERPKFNLPERPKFSMPQRPKISMPNFQLGKIKTSSLRRPLRDRNQLQSSSQSTAGSKKNILDSLNFRTYPRFFNKKKRLAEQSAKVKGKRAMTPPPRMETDSIPSSPGSRKVPFAQKWVQRYKDIKFADEENQSEKRSASLKAMSSFDDEEPVEDDSAAFRDPDFGAAFRDPDFGAATLMEESKKKIKGRSANSLMDSDREQRSSGSSSERHRVGVLEEIDSDEFFLRQKGLSREDVDLGRFLSNEIRDAFRSPKNALASMDTELYNDEDDEEICEVNNRANQQKSSQQQENTEEEKIQNDQGIEDIEPKIEPIKPSRSRSLKSRRSTQSKTSLSKTSLSRTSLDMKEDNSNFNTYPPTRPSRSRKQSMQSSIADKQSIGTADLELEIKEGFTDDEVRLDVRVPSLRSLDENDAGKLISRGESMNEVWLQETQPPLPPKRRKSTKDLSRDNDSIINEIFPQDKWIDEVNIQAMIPGDVTALHMEPVVATVTPLQHGLYDSLPVAPIRKARSRGTSLADEDRTSRGAESLVSETQSYPVEDIPVEDTETAKEDNFGYAIVEKTEHKTMERPVRNKRGSKPPRPPPISRKKRATTQMMNLKNQGIQFFFTYPRRAMKSLHKPPPIRPVRNYSTIGPSQTLPSRPPRRTKVFREPVYADDSIPFMDESEKETLDSSTPKITQQADEIILNTEPLTKDDQQPDQKEISHSNDDAKDLQSGDVIEKMKGRPLPAPPHPARKSKSETQLQSEIQEMGSNINEENKINEDEIIITERINIKITPPKELTEITSTKLTTAIKTNDDEKKHEKVPAKQNIEIKHEPEKKEGPLAALKEMISQKKKEFFEPKKEVQTTIKKETVVTKVENKSDTIESPIKIIPLKANEETETKVEEANVSTQTDPLPEGYVVEEEQQTDEQKQITIKQLKQTSPNLLQSVPKISEQLSTKSEQSNQKISEGATTSVLEGVSNNQVLTSSAPETRSSPQTIQSPSSVSESKFWYLNPDSTSSAPETRSSPQTIQSPSSVSESKFWYLNHDSTTPLSKGLKTEQAASNQDRQGQTSQVREIQTVIEKKVVVMPDPETEVSFLKAQKLQVSELDVDKLNVSELQAKKISVSDIDGVAMQISELSSKSGNLIVNGVELPPEFLQNLVSTIASSTSSSIPPPSSSQEPAETPKTTNQVIKEPESNPVISVESIQQSSSQTGQQSAPPVVVYPSQTPIVVYPPQTNPSGQSTIAVHPAIIPQMYGPEYIPSKFPRTRSPPRNLHEDSLPEPGDSEEDHSSLMPVPAKRHHRHHHHQHHSHKQSSQLSTDEEEERSSHPKQQQILQQQTAAQLLRQLLQIWQNSLQDGVFQIIEGINRAFPDGEKRKDAQTAACIILVLIAGLMIVGFGSDKTVHHHHWDFQFPPPH